MNSRKANKADFDKGHQLRQGKLQIGDLVLLFNSKDQISRSRADKLADRWRGPYRIYDVPEDSTFYRLGELDGVRLAGTFAGNRLKKFYLRTELQADRMLRREVLQEMDDAIEAEQRRFAGRNAGRLAELEEMAEEARRLHSGSEIVGVELCSGKDVCD